VGTLKVEAVAMEDLGMVAGREVGDTEVRRHINRVDMGILISMEVGKVSPKLDHSRILLCLLGSYEI
jgi:hypothetical protein